VAAAAPGRAALLAFAFTGVALVPVALAFATLGRRFDEDGGPVVFARAAFGELPSFVVGWVAYVSAFLSTSAVMAGLTRAVAPSFGFEQAWAVRALGIALVTGLALLVGSGIRISAQAWTALTVLKLLPLVALLAAFAAFAGPPVASVPAAEVSWIRAGLIVTFTLQGFEIVPVIAGQVRTSARAVPLATVGSLLIAVALYVALVSACLHALPDLARSGAPLVEAASVYGGAGLRRALGIGTSVSALGICLGMMVTTPRYLSALASGRRELFGLHRFSARGVPLRALLVTWAIVTGFVLAGDLGELFALSSIAVLLQYGVTAAALLVLAARRQRGLRPVDAWPALPALALGIALVAFGSTAREAVVSVVALASGAALWTAGRERA
jgi:APA family basic amino acid/polyamine antiporter